VGYSLDWFFDRWVFGTGVVTLPLDSVGVAEDGSEWTLTFIIIQEQTVPVALWVPIQVVTADGDVFTSVWI